MLMIDLKTYAAIRQCRKNDMSQRKTAQLLGISRNTVKRYGDGAHTPDERKAYPEHVASPQKELVMAALLKYFEENRHQLTGKQRVTAKTAWESIRGTYNVGESSVRRYVRELKEKHPEGFIPLAFEPGEVMQCDWCECKVVLDGRIEKVPVFCAVLPYSFGIFAMVMPDMKLPRVMEANTEAFCFLGNGVPAKIFYDNMKTIVFSGTGKHAIPQERFRMYEAHYAFESVFMNRASGNEKGGVENVCKLIRPAAFVPMPQGKDLKEIQDHVRERCLNYNRYHKVRGRPAPIADMLAEERAHLLPLPLKTYPAYTETTAVVGSDLTFRCNATKYSLPQEYIGKTISVRVTAYSVEAWHKGLLVCTHARPFNKGQHQYIPDHYLPLLEKRPRAIQHAAPLKYGVLPPELDKFRSMSNAKDKYEQLAKVLLLGRQFDTGELLRAVRCANRTGSPSYSMVLFYLGAQQVDGSMQQMDAMETADVVVVDRPGLSEYDVLLGGGKTDDNG